MRAGPLDRRIVIQRLSSTFSPSGQPIVSWSAIGSSRAASKTPLSGAERYNTAALEAREQVEFRIRWAADLADLQPADRIIEPAADASSSPVPERSIYDIFAVLEVGRHEGLRVLAARETVVA